MCVLTVGTVIEPIAKSIIIEPCHIAARSLFDEIPSNEFQKTHSKAFNISLKNTKSSYRIEPVTFVSR